MRHCPALYRISIIHGKLMHLRDLLYFNTIKQQLASHVSLSIVFQPFNSLPYIHSHLIMTLLFVLHDFIVPLLIYSDKPIGIYLTFFEIQKKRKETTETHVLSCAFSELKERSLRQSSATR